MVLRVLFVLLFLINLISGGQTELYKLSIGATTDGNNLRIYADPIVICYNNFAKRWFSRGGL